MSELLPCPFCGGVAALLEPPCKKCHPAWAVECQGCGLFMPGEGKGGKGSAISTWNTRYEPQGVADRLRKAGFKEVRSERDVLP